MMNYKQLHYFWAVAKTGSIVRDTAIRCGWIWRASPAHVRRRP